MSIIRVTKNDVETFTLVTNPSRSYSSSSISGVTGSVKVFPRQSPLERDTAATRLFNDVPGGPQVDENFDTAASHIAAAARTKRSAGLPVSGEAEAYVSKVESAPTKATAVLDVERFTPTTRVTKYTLVKNNVKDVLMSCYRTAYPHAHWAYTNYNTLNFFTAPGIPTSSVLLYPNSHDPSSPTIDGHVSGSYCLTGAFTFDLNINPRYNVDHIDAGHFKAGTIFHLSSSYALSLVTGSLKDPNGLPLGFRLLLQLSSSADTPPSLAFRGPPPHDLTFLSDDNSLTFNHWHRVIVRWGTSAINDGTGSFIIDGINRGDFVVPSGSVLPTVPSASLNPDVLCIGNFYDGKNYGGSSMSLFFSPNPAKRDGVDQLTSVDLWPQEDPAHYAFNHPLKAEVHDLVIKRYFVTDKELSASGSTGPGLSAKDGARVAFYLPPYFMEDSPIRRWVGDHGGIPQTPFFEIDGTTDDPFNVAMAFGVNGHYINLENFVKDFATGRFPRLMQLTASMIDHTTDAQEANAFLYADPGVAKRNLTVLPCDDGNFDPNYEILSAERFRNKYTDPNGVTDLSYINLEDLVTTASLRMGAIGSIDPDNPTADDYMQQNIGPSPDQPGLPPGPGYVNYIAAVTASLQSITDDYAFDRGVQRGVPLTIYQRTLDPSSNQVTFFNISNLYYGRRIMPGSVVLRDSAISGSAGSVGITLRDDSCGNLYRADAATPHATNASVGNVFYDEGVIVVKSPHLYFFGKEQYELSFRGVQNIYSSKYEILAASGLLNSSSNPTYLANKDQLRASGSPIDTEPFVYISGINFHDENMNVVAKAVLAQPIIKREGNAVLFKVAFDR